MEMIGIVVMLRHLRNNLAKNNSQMNMLIELCDCNWTFCGKNSCDSYLLEDVRRFCVCVWYSNIKMCVRFSN